MNILVPLGTRPEIVKLAPVISSLKQGGHHVRTVFTGQHYDESLAGSFLGDLGITVDESWKLAGGDSTRMGRMLELAIDEIATQASGRPDLVLLLGDTNTVPVFCIAARRAAVPVAHLEAGLRSFNPTSVEEVNRQIAAACVSLHLAPTELAARFLRLEGVPDRSIHVVGNPVLDVLRQWEVHRKSRPERRGVIFTAHRATNVDDPQRLRSLVQIVVELAAKVGPVTFPVHPRTQSRLRAAGLYDELGSSEGVTLLPPLPYKEMLDAVASSLVAVTDSGGLQEEASWLGVPVVVLRRSTPRWEGVENGTSKLVGVDVASAVAATVEFAGDRAQERASQVTCPYGDGRTAERVASILGDPGILEELAIREPDFTDGSLPWEPKRVIPPGK